MRVRPVSAAVVIAVLLVVGLLALKLLRWSDRRAEERAQIELRATAARS
jgi:hypothetical protein